MTNLPPGWIWTSVADLASPEPRSITDGPFGSKLKTEHYTHDGPRVVRLQNIGDGVFRDDDQAHISQERYQRLSAHAVKAGDVLIAALGDMLPRSCVAPAAIEPGIVKADCFRLRLRPRINPYFVSAILNAPQTRRQAMPLIGGIGRPRLNLSKVRQLRVPLAPSSEQDRIVATIEEQFSRIESGWSTLSAVQRSLPLLIGSVLNHSIGQAQTVRLGTVLKSLRNGIFVSRPGAIRTDRPILRISAVRPLSLDSTDVRYVPPETHIVNESSFLLQPGDLLFTRYNGSPALVGSCAMVRDAGVGFLYPDKLIRAVVRTDVADPEYLELALNCGISRSTIQRMVKTTAGQAGIGGSELKSVPIPLPALEEQRRAVLYAREWLEGAADLRRLIGQCMQRSASLRDAVLGSAFAGNLVQQDMRDEPASGLIQRLETGSPVYKERDERRDARRSLVKVTA